MAEVAKLRDVILNPQHLQLSEHTMAVFTADCELGITVEDLKNPAYWAHVAPQLQPYYQIWARAEDGSWMAHLTVLSCSRNWAKVHVLNYYELAAEDIEADQSTHKVEWKGPHRKFSVIRIKDGEVIKDGYADKNAALSALVEHERMTG